MNKVREFVSEYKTGNIIFPQAVARNVGETGFDVMAELNDMTDEGLIRVRLSAICPNCGKDPYECEDVDYGDDLYCDHCDTDFILGQTNAKISFIKNATRKDIGSQIDKHCDNIINILDDFKKNELTEYNLDVLVKNELIGIQEKCEELGVKYYE